jgi:hypothetical protein
VVQSRRERDMRHLLENLTGALSSVWPGKRSGDRLPGKLSILGTTTEK